MRFLNHFRAAYRGQRFGWPVATCALIAANLIAWCAVAWFYHLSPLAPQHSLRLLRVGAVNGELLLAGEWWRIITSQFLHVHFPHMIFNMLALLFLGGLLELEYGSWRLLVLYFGSGVVGQFAGVIATPALVSSGSSQALMGLAGGMVVVSLRQRQKSMLKLVPLLAIIGTQAALDLVAAGGIKAGHLWGFCAGAVIAFVLYRRGVSA